jgi:poly(hydroxyalkanoate) depolymerase family esterase
MRSLPAVLLAVLALTPGVAAAAPDPPDPGQTTSGTVTSNGDDYRYLLYTPTSYTPGRPVPLVVMVHGCQTTAEQHMKSTLYNRVAEREGFVVLYVDVDALGRAQPGPASNCWKFPYPPAYFRGNSDAAAIADMTRAIMAQRTIDPERVYLSGISAGGLMAAVEAAAYPELYAAVAIVESSAYGDGPCFTTGVGIPVETSAQLAFDQMGPRARIVPRFVTGSDADLAFPEPCAEKALEQGLRTNNLVLGDSQTAPISLSPAAVRQERRPGGLSYTDYTYRDPAGCLVGERWLIHGMPHAWPGGTNDPKYVGWNDPRAPDGAEGTWAFFQRYRRSDTAMPCAETPPAHAPAPAAATCPARKVTVVLGRGAHVQAWVRGHRVPAKTRGRRVTITLPAGRRAAVRVVLHVWRHHRTRTVRRTFALC